MKKLAALAGLFSIAMWGCVTEPKETEIVFRNRTASVYNAVYIKACANTVWGANRLNGEVILQNTNRTFQVEPGCWDLRAETTNNRYVEFMAIEVTSGTYTLTATN